ncbi:MAG TPA: hypothetical protein VJ768_03385, partial [Anaerolineales bacterium]|nr:hypothetical protein [Anaerolineales bacterium]
MSKKLLLVIGLILALALVACQPAATEAPATDAPPAEEATAPPAETEPPAEEGTGVTELTILWAQWDPADYLQQIGNMYEEETGIKVNVVQEPWGSFGDLFFTEMAAGGTSWDMV